MDPSAKKYVINLSQIDEQSRPLVGERALLLHEIDKLNIPIPQTFVIAANAFDDFIVANKLVEFISERINDIDYSNRSKVRGSATDIQKAILNATMPDIIAEPLGKAYSGLGGLFEAFVSIKSSPLTQEMNEVNYNKTFNIINVKGEAQLFEKVKALWAEVFSEQAMLFRASTSYEGAVTQALIVQRMVQSEVSGRVFTVSPAYNKNEVEEIQAVLGLIDIMVAEGEHVADSYFYNREVEEIIDKKVMPQEKMLVRKGRTTEANPNTTVNISEVWQKKQKLEDRYVLNLGRIGKALHDLFEKPLVIEFAFETGRLHITEITAEDRKPLAALLKNENVEKKLSTLEKYGGGEFEKVKEKNNVAILDENTKSAVVDMSVMPDQDKIGKLAAEVKADVKTGAVINKKQDPNVSFEEEKVVVEIHPIDKLEKILEGTGFGKGANYGLVQFVFAQTDWLELTGDCIMVFKNLPIDHIEEINKQRGLILENTIKEEHLGLIKIPVIHSIKGAMQILHEGEVITVVPETGTVYVGAGKLDGDKNGEKKEFTQVSATPADGEIKFASAQVTEEHGKDEVIRTTTRIWQIFDAKAPSIDKNHADGIWLDLGDYYQAAGLNPEYLLTEPELKKTFIAQAVESIATSLKSAEERPAIIQAASVDPELLAKLKGTDSSNFSHKNLRGAAKFLANPELLIMDLQVLDELRNKHGLRNLWFAVPHINTAAEQGEIKKIVSSYGFRRSSTFKLLSVISTPLASISTTSLVENDIDGIVLDFDSLAQAFLSTNYVMDETLLRFLFWTVESISSNKSRAYVLNRKGKMEKDVIKALLGRGVDNFIVPHNELYTFKLLVSGLEIKRIETTKKRGRKKKKIDYGF